MKRKPLVIGDEEKMRMIDRVLRQHLPKDAAWVIVVRLGDNDPHFQTVSSVPMEYCEALLAQALVNMRDENPTKLSREN